MKVFLGPNQAILVEGALGSRHRLPSPPVVIARIAFAKVIRWHLNGETTQCFLDIHFCQICLPENRSHDTHPVNLVLVVGRKEERADNTGTWSRFQLKRDFAVENVVVGD